MQIARATRLKLRCCSFPPRRYDTDRAAINDKPLAGESVGAVLKANQKTLVLIPVGSASHPVLIIDESEFFFFWKKTFTV